MLVDPKPDLAFRADTIRDINPSSLAADILPGYRRVLDQLARFMRQHQPAVFIHTCRQVVAQAYPLDCRRARIRVDVVLGFENPVGALLVDQRNPIPDTRIRDPSERHGERFGCRDDSCGQVLGHRPHIPASDKLNPDQMLARCDVHDADIKCKHMPVSGAISQWSSFHRRGAGADPDTQQCSRIQTRSASHPHPLSRSVRISGSTRHRRSGADRTKWVARRTT